MSALPESRPANDLKLAFLLKVGHLSGFVTVPARQVPRMCQHYTSGGSDTHNLHFLITQFQDWPCKTLFGERCTISMGGTSNQRQGQNGGRGFCNAQNLGRKSFNRCLASTRTTCVRLGAPYSWGLGRRSRHPWDPHHRPVPHHPPFHRPMISAPHPPETQHTPAAQPSGFPTPILVTFAASIWLCQWQTVREAPKILALYEWGVEIGMRC